LKKDLKLVTLYYVHRNEYSVFRHNLADEDADQAAQELSDLQPSIFIIDQSSRHTTENPETCDACQKDVERASHLQPKPSFKRRSE
jgi:hypothetical protein